MFGTVSNAATRGEKGATAGPLEVACSLLAGKHPLFLKVGSFWPTRLMVVSVAVLCCMMYRKPGKNDVDEGSVNLLPIELYWAAIVSVSL